MSVRNSVADRVRLTATGGASGAGGFLHAVYSNVALVNTTVANSAAVFGGTVLGCGGRGVVVCRLGLCGGRASG